MKENFLAQQKVVRPKPDRRLCHWFVLESIPADLRDSQATVILSDPDWNTKILGVEWNASNDHFHVSVTELPSIECTTKRSLVSNVAKTFDVLGWYSPTLVKAKILLQMLWLERVGWDDYIPNAFLKEWSKWKRGLPLLSAHCIPRCYCPKEANIVSTQLHGFCDASEKANAGVVYPGPAQAVRLVRFWPYHFLESKLCGGEAYAAQTNFWKFR